MNVTKNTTRVASANWKAFHDAKLHKKYAHYHLTWDDRLIKTRRAALKTEHYLLYNLLRNLPASRGYEHSGESFGVALANLKKSSDAQINAYLDFFGFTSFEEQKIRRIIAEA